MPRFEKDSCPPETIPDPLKLTNIPDVKRYLNVATIARYGPLVVKRSNPLQPSSELIIVPRCVIDGLVTALHFSLDHPSKH